jgi:hypothetical protein
MTSPELDLTPDGRAFLRQNSAEYGEVLIPQLLDALEDQERRAQFLEDRAVKLVKEGWKHQNARHLISKLWASRRRWQDDAEHWRLRCGYNKMWADEAFEELKAVEAKVDRIEAVVARAEAKMCQLDPADLRAIIGFGR